MFGKPKSKQWRLLSHEAFFRLTTADKVAYLKAAVEEYDVRVDVKPPRPKRKRGGSAS